MRKRPPDLIYKSSLEKKAADLLPPECKYEPDKIAYEIPRSMHKYTPDFKIKDKVYIEVKGIFDSDDRKKHLLVKQQHPDIQIKFLFGKPHNKLNRASKTTYAMWCEANGFEWADIKEGIPKDWLK